MKYIKILFTFFVVLFFKTSFSQDIKTYSGNYKEGKSTYQYYENEELERIYHGNFSYSRDLFGKSTVYGNYVDNLKDGKWIFTDIDEKVFGLGTHTSEKLIINYKNGLANGLASYVKTNLETKKIIQTSTVNFRNGKLIGDYYFWSKNTEDTYETKYVVNSNGFIDGDFKHSYSEYGEKFEDIRKYKNGIIYWQLHRNIETGEIINKVDNKEWVFSYFENLDASQNYNIVDSIWLNDYKTPNCCYNYKEFSTKEVNGNYLFHNMPISIVLDTNSNLIENEKNFWSKVPTNFLSVTDVNLNKGAWYPYTYVMQQFIIPENIDIELVRFLKKANSIDRLDSFINDSKNVDSIQKYITNCDYKISSKSLNLVNDEMNKFLLEFKNQSRYNESILTILDKYDFVESLPKLNELYLKCKENLNKCDLNITKIEKELEESGKLIDLVLKTKNKEREVLIDLADSLKQKLVDDELLFLIYNFLLKEFKNSKENPYKISEKIRQNSIDLKPETLLNYIVILDNLKKDFLEVERAFNDTNNRVFSNLIVVDFYYKIKQVQEYKLLSNKLVQINSELENNPLLLEKVMLNDKVAKVKLVEYQKLKSYERLKEAISMKLENINISNIKGDELSQLIVLSQDQIKFGNKVLELLNSKTKKLEKELKNIESVEEINKAIMVFEIK